MAVFSTAPFALNQIGSLKKQVDQRIQPWPSSWQWAMADMLESSQTIGSNLRRACQLTDLAREWFGWRTKYSSSLLVSSASPPRRPHYEAARKPLCSSSALVKPAITSAVTKSSSVVSLFIMAGSDPVVIVKLLRFRYVLQQRWARCERCQLASLADQQRGGSNWLWFHDGYGL